MEQSQFRALQPLPRTLHDLPVIAGASRGRTIGTPTINVDLAHVPRDIPHGVYACRVTVHGTRYQGALHYGQRPVFHDSEAMEVHVIDATIDRTPETIDITIVAKIRDVQAFENTETLQTQIHHDIDHIRGILNDA